MFLISSSPLLLSSPLPWRGRWPWRLGPDYQWYLDAVASPIGGADSHVVRDEGEEEWILEREDDHSTDDAEPAKPLPADPARLSKTPPRIVFR